MLQRATRKKSGCTEVYLIRRTFDQFRYENSINTTITSFSVFLLLFLGTMLKITPAEIITFSKVGNELVGTVDVVNNVKYSITYKVMQKYKSILFFNLSFITTKYDNFQ